MRYYFDLQYRILHRQLEEFGIKPLYGYILGAACFILLTLYLWSVTSYAPYLYALMGLSLTGLMADPARIAFLRQHFQRHMVVRIRITENLIVVAPFVMGLLCFKAWIPVMGILVVASMLAFPTAPPSVAFVIPTPFYRYPFEFVTGFRKNLLILMMVAGILVMAIRYDNLNLALFTCALVWLIALTFYTASEPAYLVWIHRLQPAKFLWYKIRVAIGYATCLMLPYVIATMLFFQNAIGPLLLIWILGWLYLIAVILGKYAFYPSSMNVPQGIVMMMSFGFPPLLIVLIPYFYRQSLRRLQPILA